MSTDDHFARIAILESALAQAQADLLGADGRIQMAVQLYEDEKASHTDTLVKLRLTEEALAASEAERRRLQERCEGLAAGQQILVELMEDDDAPTEPMAAKDSIEMGARKTEHRFKL